MAQYGVYQLQPHPFQAALQGLRQGGQAPQQPPQQPTQKAAPTPPQPTFTKAKAAEYFFNFRLPHPPFPITVKGDCLADESAVFRAKFMNHDVVIKLAAKWMENDEDENGYYECEPANCHKITTERQNQSHAFTCLGRDNVLEVCHLDPRYVNHVGYVMMTKFWGRTELDVFAQGNEPYLARYKMAYKYTWNLAALHACGLLHGDYDLQNLRLNARTLVKVYDMEYSKYHQLHDTRCIPGARSFNKNQVDGDLRAWYTGLQMLLPDRPYGCADLWTLFQSGSDAIHGWTLVLNDLYSKAPKDFCKQMDEYHYPHWQLGNPHQRAG